MSTKPEQPEEGVCVDGGACGAMQGEDFVSRQIHKKVLSVAQGEGHGATVRRSIGRPELRNYDPFLMLDEFRVSKPAGFPDHPHRGFETVTYMLPTSEGTFEHEDFAGHRGKIGPGDLQWMTAGRGIVHAEMPANDKESHGLQLWVNLKAKDKLCDPTYQELVSEDVPEVSADGVTVHVIAGSALGTTSKVHTRTPTAYLHFIMEPNAQLQQPIDKGWNAFVYVLEGSGTFGGDSEEGDGAVQSDAHHTLALTNKDGEDGVHVVAGDEGCSFVLISGEPTNEPIVQHGPMVMNSRDEIYQAFLDYQEGKNGFERAHSWSSEIGKSLR